MECQRPCHVLMRSDHPSLSSRAPREDGLPGRSSQILARAGGWFGLVDGAGGGARSAIDRVDVGEDVSHWVASLTAAPGVRGGVLALGELKKAAAHPGRSAPSRDKQRSERVTRRAPDGVVRRCRSANA